MKIIDTIKNELGNYQVFIEDMPGYIIINITPRGTARIHVHTDEGERITSTLYNNYDEAIKHIHHHAA
jgi:hypothetical protein